MGLGSASLALPAWAHIYRRTTSRLLCTRCIGAEWASHHEGARRSANKGILPVVFAEIGAAFEEDRPDKSAPTQVVGHLDSRIAHLTLILYASGNPPCKDFCALVFWRSVSPVTQVSVRRSTRSGPRRRSG
jgi:hypothetical protein